MAHRTTRMANLSKTSKLETLIARDAKLVFTLTSYILALATYANGSTLQSSFLGLIISVPYFAINSIFLGRAFFKNEDPFFRLMLGVLSLVLLLGFASWLAVIIYNLSIANVFLVLFAVATICSLLNRKVSFKNADY